jgi:succinate dehydrogenase hydrophobic anchor subunit
VKGLWAWIFQRFTAVLLVLLLGTHFFVMHFVDPLAEIDFARSSFNLKSSLYFIFDSGLLAVGLFHGLNGIRNIILDWWPKAGKTAGWVLSLIGIVAAGYGSTALLAFINTK